MELFQMVFNGQTIYDTLFLDIKVVAEYENTEVFAEKDPQMHDKWVDLANIKYGEATYSYHKNAVNFPEFSKIIAITIGVINNVDGKMQRHLESIEGETEKELIGNFFSTILEPMHKKGAKQYICGHGLSTHHIPFLIKRGLKHGYDIPEIFKVALRSKPWDGILIDTSLVWKFNSIGFNSIDMIAQFLELPIQKNITLRKPDTISGYYYNSLVSNNNIDWVRKQSINEVNLLIQILKLLR